MRWFAALALLLGPTAALGSPSSDFDARFQAVATRPSLVFRIEAPRVHTSTAAIAGGARPRRDGGRGSVYIDASFRGLTLDPPALPSEDDLAASVRERLDEVRACHARQLDAEPGWHGRLLLDLAVRRSGRVGEVSVSPLAVAESPLGSCLLRRVPRWQFPIFTGETAPDLTLEAITASFAFVFEPAP